MDQQLQQAVDQVITSRHSVRAFLDTPVDRKILKEILQVASRAPSGTNTQPWRVYVVQGRKRDALIEKVSTAQSALFLNP